MKFKNNSRNSKTSGHPDIMLYFISLLGSGNKETKISELSKERQIDTTDDKLYK